MQSSSMPSFSPSPVMDIVDRTFRIYRNNFLPFAGLVALVVIPFTLFSLAIAPDPITIGEDINWEEYFNTVRDQTATSSLISLLQQFLLLVIVNSVITFITSESYLGRQVSLPEGFQQISGRMISLVGAALLVGFIFFVLLLILSVLTALCGIPIILAPALLYYGMALYFFLTPVIILERTSASFGAYRAQYLGRARFWPTLGFVVAIWIVITIIGIVFGSVGGLLGAGSLDSSNTIGIIINLASTIFITPILPIGLTLMYYDTRIRVEGLDIALQSVPSSEPRPSDVSSPDPPIGMVTGRDVMNIVLLVVGMIGLLCGLSILLSLFIGVAF